MLTTLLGSRVLPPPDLPSELLGNNFIKATLPNDLTLLSRLGIKVDLLISSVAWVDELVVFHVLW